MLANASNRHTHRWCRWLADAGNEVALFSDSRPRPDMDYASIRIIGPDWTFWRKVYAFKLRGGKYANNHHKWLAYRDAIVTIQPDVLHAMEGRAYGPMLARFPKYPRVLTPWGTDMEQFVRYKETTKAAAGVLSDTFHSARQLIEEAKLTELALRSADMISTNAPGLEGEWARASGLDKSKFALFSWGVDTGVFRPVARLECEPLLRAVGIDPGRPYLLSPRLAQANYRIDRLMRAWTHAKKEPERPRLMNEARLVVLRAGASSPAWEDLMEYHASLGDASILMIDRYFSPAEMACLYNASAGVVMIPLWDLLAMSLLEAMACGATPVLVEQPCYRSVLGDWGRRESDRGAAIMVVESGLKEGLLRWAALGESERAEIGAINAEQIARHHRWENCAAGMYEVYERARATGEARMGQGETPPR